MTAQTDVTNLRAGAEAPPVPLLLELVASLGRGRVRYCYWKSRRRLEAVMSGESDLDLLVLGEDQQIARRALLDCGFKEFRAVPARDHPAISSFLGYDAPSGLIVHVHLHLRLVVGGKLLNEYRLPWEAAFLSWAEADP